MGYTVTASETVGRYQVKINNINYMVAIPNNEYFKIYVYFESREVTAKGAILVWCNNWSKEHPFFCYIGSDMSPSIIYNMFFPITPQALEVFILDWIKNVDEFRQQLYERLDIFPIKKKMFFNR